MLTYQKFAVFAVLTLSLVALAAQPPAPGMLDVSSLGAKGDGQTLDTAAVQKAIDTCAGRGGGAVYFGPGVYLCGSLRLRSHVRLYLDTGSIIKGSPNDADYDPYEDLGFKNDADRETTYFHFALIWGEDVEDITIEGPGTIDSNRTKRHGPKTIALKRCRFVTIRDVRLLNAPNYNISMLGTDFVNIDGVTILNGYCDGIDPDSCQNVRISNCHIESVDDAIVPKASFSLGERRACENITVTNCYLATKCNAFKLGTESGGDFKRITVSNCVMDGFQGQPATGGIAIESVDGSHVDGIAVSNVSMSDVRVPIFIRLGNRGRDMETPTPGSLQNVTISNVIAANASLTSSITGIPGHPVRDITLSNIRIVYAGGGPFSPDPLDVPEKIDAYPDGDMFDVLPCYGLYARHAVGLSLHNVSVAYEDGYWRVPTNRYGDVDWRRPDGIPQPSAPGRPGPAIVCDDVHELSVDGLRARPTAADPVVRLVNVTQALIRGSQTPGAAPAFVEVRGEASAGIALVGNDLRGLAKVALADGAKKSAISLTGNIR